MNIRLIAKDTHTLTKVIDTEDYPNTDIDTLIDVEDNELRKAYAKKYNESCGTVIVKVQTCQNQS
jgi:hypothetical protein|tara:strand:+ start:6569 stop:6763 length:195 start_codon:yes stop_codon:yes gene_type:complete